MDGLRVHGNIFIKALTDSLSFHRTLRILVNDSTIALLTAKILLTNLFLLVGSHFLYHNGITPLLQFVNDHESFLQSQQTNSGDNFKDSSIAWFLFKSLWLLPVCLLCYGCSTIWYQELADCTYKYLKKNQKVSPSKDAAHAIYGTLIWLFLYLQVQFLTAVTPVVCGSLPPYTDLFFSRVEERFNQSYPLFTWTSSVLRLLSLQAVNALSVVLQIYGYLLMSLLYGWYAFDPQWIAANVDPDARCGLMERHWAYFVGFGAPYVLLLKNTSFFVGFGTFLALFPFCIMLGSLSSYSAPYQPDPDPSNASNSSEQVQPRGSLQGERDAGSSQDSSGSGQAKKPKPSSKATAVNTTIDIATALPLFSMAKGLTLWTLRLVRRSMTTSSPSPRAGKEKGGKKD